MNVIVCGESSRLGRIFDLAKTVIEMHGGANDKVHPRRLHREARR